MSTSRFTGAVTTVLVWAFVWVLPAGVIEAIDNIAPAAHGFTRQIDMWPQTLGLPGLVAGLLFAVLLLVTGGGRFAEVALSRAAVWGAVAASVVGMLVVWVLDTGLSQPVQLAVALLGVATLLGAVSGVTSVFLLRLAGRRAATS